MVTTTYLGTTGGGGGGLTEIIGADLTSGEVPEELKTGDWLVISWDEGEAFGGAIRFTNGKVDYTLATKTRVWKTPWPG